MVKAAMMGQRQPWWMVGPNVRGWQEVARHLTCHRWSKGSCTLQWANFLWTMLCTRPTGLPKSRASGGRRGVLVETVFGFGCVVVNGTSHHEVMSDWVRNGSAFNPSPSPILADIYCFQCFSFRVETSQQQVFCPFPVTVRGVRSTSELRLVVLYRPILFLGHPLYLLSPACLIPP